MWGKGKELYFNCQILMFGTNEICKLKELGKDLEGFEFI